VSSGRQIQVDQLDAGRDPGQRRLGAGLDFMEIISAEKNITNLIREAAISSKKYWHKFI
jgi:hypothetical protein